jgi:hypothetical protein
MKFKIEINMNNAAFANPDELPSIVWGIAELLMRGYSPTDGGAICASNGNIVGEWEVNNEYAR